MVVVERIALGDALAARYVAPLPGLSHGDGVLDTVWHFLRMGAQVDRASAELSVNPNTVRNGLTRFEQLVDLHRACTSVRAA